MFLGMDMFFRWAVLLLLGFCLLFQATCIGARSATLSLGQSLSPGQSLISPGGEFELGFFSPGNSSNAYVGIWYATIPVQTVVWVLNRDNPILNSSSNATLMLSGANLQLFNEARELIWFTNVSSTVSNTTQAMLLDTGNFVVKNDVFTYWQSFDYPTDTWLPGMKFGFDETSGKNITLSSWTSNIDPGPGLFSLQMDPSGNGEFFIRKNSLQTFWRSGPWDGEGFPSITRGLGSNPLNLSYDGKYLLYSVENDESIISRIVMTTPGALQLLIWTESTENWNVFLSIPSDICERLGFCGDYGICDISTSPVCLCLTGFVPKSTKYWELGNFSGGCERRSPLHCNSNEGGEVGFLKFGNVKWPSSSQPLELGRIKMCEILCLYNCTCNAFAYASNGRCLFWNELLDLERLGNNSTGGDLYLKYPRSVLPPTGTSVLPPTGARHKRLPVTAIAATAASIASAIFVCCTCLCYIWRRNLKRKGVKETTQTQNQNLLLFDLNGDVAAPNASTTLKDSNGMDKYKNYELPMFSFPSVALATDNFSIANKLGEGGFGPVYKGKLLNGQLVAIKRLSKRSGQGLKEFRTETELIAKLQHRNLVRILGCCIELEEMILIYEYMPNKSLDSFLFVPTNQEQLDWAKRVHIIEGIAQGLLYLHQYSRLRIVHRDLKASNILLDGEMNPKISDFGLARIFGGNELQANTDRIVGTYGYMSPEYAMEGLFSVKSDVFAFGVLLLEIISGKKNTGFYGADCLSLLGHAWELWTNDKVLELLDPVVQVHGSSASPDRYIAIGLLCVQERPADRPAMSEVVAMLSNEQATLASPKQPAFTAGRTVVFNAAGEVQICSANKLTISVIAPR